MSALWTLRYESRAARADLDAIRYKPLVERSCDFSPDATLKSTAHLILQSIPKLNEQISTTPDYAIRDGAIYLKDRAVRVLEDQLGRTISATGFAEAFKEVDGPAGFVPPRDAHMDATTFAKTPERALAPTLEMTPTESTNIFDLSFFDTPLKGDAISGSPRPQGTSSHVGLKLALEEEIQGLQNKIREAHAEYDRRENDLKLDARLLRVAASRREQEVDRLKIELDETKTECGRHEIREKRLNDEVSVLSRWAKTLGRYLLWTLPRQVPSNESGRDSKENQPGLEDWAKLLCEHPDQSPNIFQALLEPKVSPS